MPFGVFPLSLDLALSLDTQMARVVAVAEENQSQNLMNLLPPDWIVAVLSVWVCL